MIEFNITLEDAISKLKQDEPFAEPILKALATHWEEFDPECSLGWKLIFQQIDKYDLGGKKLIYLHEYCHNNLLATYTIFRGLHLAEVKIEEVLTALEGKGTLDVQGINQRIKEFLLGKFQSLYRQPSTKWLEKMAALEDGCCISVGGLYCDIGLYTQFPKEITQMYSDLPN